MATRTQGQIDEQTGRATDVMNDGSKYPGMSYEEGVIAALDWITGQSEDKPMEDD